MKKIIAILAFLLALGQASRAQNNHTAEIIVKQLKNETPRDFLFQISGQNIQLNAGEDQVFNITLEPALINDNSFTLNDTNPLNKQIKVGEPATQQFGWIDISRFQNTLTATVNIQGSPPIIITKQVDLFDPLHERYGISIILSGANLENSQIILSDLSGEVALLPAVQAYNFAAIKRIAQKHKLSSITDDEGNNALHIAVQKDWNNPATEELIGLLLFLDPQLLDATNNNGESPLALASPVVTQKILNLLGSK